MREQRGAGVVALGSMKHGGGGELWRQHGQGDETGGYGVHGGSGKMA